jgi:hypothetical protein
MGFTCLGSLCSKKRDRSKPYALLCYLSSQGNSVVQLTKIVWALLALAPCAVRKEIETNPMLCFAAQ